MSDMEVVGQADADLPTARIDGFLHFAATIIQSAFRGYAQRKQYRTMVRSAL